MHTEARHIALDEIKYLDSIEYVAQMVLERSVTHRVRNRLLEQGYPEESQQFWNDACLGMRTGDPAVIERWGEELVDLHNRVDKESRKRDKFTMPEWGTRGT